MSGKPLPMDGYIRVSSVAGRAGDRFQSPDAQREAIQAWAKAHGATIAKIHEDLDRSGGTMNRPGMNEAIRRVDQGLSGGVIVARLDRFARTVIGGLTVVKDLDARGARVVSVAENIDPATPMGKAMLGLLLIMAEWQRDQAIEHLITSQQRAAKEGRYAGRASFGYRRDEKGRQVIDLDTAPVVKRIFGERAGGAGWRQIVAGLTRDRIPTSTGLEHWSESTVMGIVGSIAPLGIFVGPGGLRVDDAWEPIITQDLWDAANQPGVKTDVTRKHDDRLLVGIARCAHCLYTLNRIPNTKSFVSYSCGTRACTERCSVGVDVLDSYVRDLIDQRLARAALNPAPADDRGEEARLLAARQAAAQEFEVWRDDLGLRAAIGDTDWREGIIARAAARDAAHEAYVEHRATIGRPELASLPDGTTPKMADLPWEVQKEIARAALHSVLLRPGKVRGPHARRHVGDRVLVTWADDPNPPAIHLPGSAPKKVTPKPVRW